MRPRPHWGRAGARGDNYPEGGYLQRKKGKICLQSRTIPFNEKKEKKLRSLHGVCTLLCHERDKDGAEAHDDGKPAGNKGQENRCNK
jgi:hypothetical protein